MLFAAADGVAAAVVVAVVVAEGAAGGADGAASAALIEADANVADAASFACVGAAVVKAAGAVGLHSAANHWPTMFSADQTAVDVAAAVVDVAVVVSRAPSAEDVVDEVGRVAVAVTKPPRYVGRR